ncbi:MAG: hypothetical protein QXE80_03685 [Pyrobaculum sp.]
MSPEELDLLYERWFSEDDITFSRGTRYFVLKRAWWNKQPPENLRREVWIFVKGHSEPEEITRPLSLHEAIDYIEKNF